MNNGDIFISQGWLKQFFDILRNNKGVIFIHCRSLQQFFSVCPFAFYRDEHQQYLNLFNNDLFQSYISNYLVQLISGSLFIFKHRSFNVLQFSCSSANKQWFIMIKTKNNFFSFSKETLRPSTSIRQDLIRKSFNTQTKARNRQTPSKTESSALFYTPKKITIESPKNIYRNAFGTLSQESKKKLESRSLIKKRKMSSSYSRARNKQQKAQSSELLQRFPTYNEEFISKMNQIEEEYVQSYTNSLYQQAARALIKILNYSIDLNMPNFFLRSIKQIAQFYFFINKINYALFYFNQTIMCAFLFNDSEFIIQAIIRCSQCCIKYQMFHQAIIILKKGLETCWFFKKCEQQLKIYDQIGKVYYLMGELGKAIQFHNKFIHANIEAQNSPQKTLSRQRMSKWMAQNKITNYDRIDLIFLANLTLPILNFSELPPIHEAAQKIRNQFKINTKYVNNLSDFGIILIKVLEQQFFQNQMQDPETISSCKYLSPKNRRNDFIQLKLKQYLRQLGIGTSSKIELRPKNVEYKQILQEKVRKKLLEPGLEKNWEEKMIRSIKRDRQNKLFKIKSQIRVRGKNRPIRPEIDHIRKLFAPLYL